MHRVNKKIRRNLFESSMYTQVRCESVELRVRAPDDYSVEAPEANSQDSVEAPEDSDTVSVAGSVAEAKQSELPVLSFLVRLKKPRLFDKGNFTRMKKVSPAATQGRIPDLLYAMRYRKGFTAAQMNNALYCADEHQCYSFYRKPPTKKVASVDVSSRPIRCQGCLRKFFDELEDFPEEFDEKEMTLHLKELMVSSVKKTKAQEKKYPKRAFFDLCKRSEEVDDAKLKKFKALGEISSTAPFFRPMKGHVKKGGIQMVRCLATGGADVMMPLWYSGVEAKSGEGGDNTYEIEGVDLKTGKVTVLSGLGDGASKTNHCAEWIDYFKAVNVWLKETPGDWDQLKGAYDLAVLPLSEDWRWLVENGEQYPPKRFYINRYFLGVLNGIWECGQELCWNYGVYYWLFKLFGEDLEPGEIRERLEQKTEDSWLIKGTNFYFNDTARMLFVCEAVCYFDNDEFLAEIIELMRAAHAAAFGNPSGRVPRGTNGNYNPLVMSRETFPELYDVKNFQVDAPGYLSKARVTNRKTELFGFPSSSSSESAPLSSLGESQDIDQLLDDGPVNSAQIRTGGKIADVFDALDNMELTLKSWNRSESYIHRSTATFISSVWKMASTSWKQLGSEKQDNIETYRFMNDVPEDQDLGLEALQDRLLNALTEGLTQIPAVKLDFAEDGVFEWRYFTKNSLPVEEAFVHFPAVVAGSMVIHKGKVDVPVLPENSSESS